MLTSRPPRCFFPPESVATLTRTGCWLPLHGFETGLTGFLSLDAQGEPSTPSTLRRERTLLPPPAGRRTRPVPCRLPYRAWTGAPRLETEQRRRAVARSPPARPRPRPTASRPAPFDERPPASALRCPRLSSFSSCSLGSARRLNGPSVPLAFSSSSSLLLLSLPPPPNPPSPSRLPRENSPFLLLPSSPSHLPPPSLLISFTSCASRQPPSSHSRRCPRSSIRVPFLIVARARKVDHSSDVASFRLHHLLGS